MSFKRLKRIEINLWTLIDQGFYLFVLDTLSHVIYYIGMHFMHTWEEICVKENG